MDKLKRHWTAQKTDDFVFQIASDFTLQLEKKLEAGPITNKEFADRLKVTEGRVSQVFNNPGNFKLKSMVEYARALGLKLAVVAYDDRDPGNTRGPINSEIFSECWKSMGSPRDFFDLKFRAHAPIAVIYASYAAQPCEVAVANEREDRRHLSTTITSAATTRTVMVQ